MLFQIILRLAYTYQQPSKSDHYFYFSRFQLVFDWKNLDREHSFHGYSPFYLYIIRRGSYLNFKFAGFYYLFHFSIV